MVYIVNRYTRRFWWQAPYALTWNICRRESDFS